MCVYMCVCVYVWGACDVTCVKLFLLFKHL